jgi:ketosteroid isomerase-like protein
MNRLMLVGALLLGVATGVQAQQAGQADADAVKAAELRRFEVMTAKDYTALATLLGDDLVYTHSSAAVDSKASYLESLTSGRVTYKVIKPTDLQVRVFGDIAVIHGVAAMNVDANGQAIVNTLRFTDIWARRDGRWQMIAWQSTRLP